MSARWTLCAMLVLAGLQGGCRKDSGVNKIMEGLPVNTSETVVPARAVQEFHLVIRDAMSVVVPVVNRLGTSNATYTELTALGGMSYSFQIHETHYGTVTGNLQFRDASNSPIDPIATPVSTFTVKSMTLTLTGNSNRFNLAMNNGVLTLDTAGDTSSDKRLTGTFLASGQGYAVTFSMGSPGLQANYRGVSGGRVTASGNGPTSPFSAELNYSTDLNLDGTISWENRSGGLHFLMAGPGYVVSNNEKFLID